MIDIGQAIMNVEKHNKRVEDGVVLFGDSVPCLKDAIKIMKMWRKLKDDHGPLIVKFPTHEKTIGEYMDEIENKFFGSIPKSKDREEKFDKIIQAVYNSYIYASEKVNDERENIISKLIKLRDEEKDVCLK